MSAKEWFLIYCEDDFSYSVVPAKDIICEESVTKEDVVTFFYNSIEYRGRVKEFGGEDHYDALVREQDKLNALNKKSRDSFHEGKPRKAALKQRVAMKSIAGTSRTGRVSKRKKLLDDHTSTQSSEDDLPLSAMKNELSTPTEEDKKSNDKSTRSGNLEGIKKLEHSKKGKKHCAFAADKLDMGSVSGDLPKSSLGSHGVSSSEETTDNECGIRKGKTVKCSNTLQSIGEKHHAHAGKKLVMCAKKNDDTSTRSRKLEEIKMLEHSKKGKKHCAFAADKLDMGSASGDLPKSSLGSYGVSSSEETTDNECGIRKGETVKRSNTLQSMGEEHHAHAGKKWDQSSKVASTSESSDSDDDRSKKRSTQKVEPTCSGGSTSSADDVEDDLMDTQSADDMTEEERQVCEKAMDILARKKTQDDELALRRLASKLKGPPDGTSKSHRFKSVSLLASTSKPLNHHTIAASTSKQNRAATASCSKRDLSSINVRQLCVRHRKPRNPRSQENIDAHVFNGDMLRFGGTEEGVTELFPRTNVCLLNTDLDRIRKLCKSATSVARQLLDAIFTPEALLECSLMGELFTAHGKGSFSKRSALDPHAVQTIIEYAEKRAEKKKWQPLQTVKDIKHSMRCKLNEMRFAFKNNNNMC